MAEELPPETENWQRPADAVIEEVVTAIAWNADGLAPVVTQAAVSGEVLMLAWMSPESLRITLEDGQVTYWSRSRKELWRKGATSGHRQRLLSLAYDCDQDAILVKVEQAGPACHTNRRSCFYHEVTAKGVEVRLKPLDG